MSANDNDDSRPISSIGWAAVDKAPLSDTPDDDSPELDEGQFAQLKPLREVLPEMDFGKQRITIMVNTAVINAYKAKAGWRAWLPNVD